jgi:hypothetical protein
LLLFLRQYHLSACSVNRKGASGMHKDYTVARRYGKWRASLARAAGSFSEGKSMTFPLEKH